MIVQGQSVSIPFETSSLVSTHNYCDSATWGSPSSIFRFQPDAEHALHILQIEAQVTNDVDFSTADKFHQHVFAAGGAMSIIDNSFSDYFAAVERASEIYCSGARTGQTYTIEKLIFRFRDPIILLSSQGMGLEFYMDNDTALTGTKMSCSVLVMETGE